MVVGDSIYLSGMIHVNHESILRLFKRKRKTLFFCIKESQKMGVNFLASSIFK